MSFAWRAANAMRANACDMWVNATANGLVRDLNPGPLAPKARIIPLDQRAGTARLPTKRQRLLANS